MDSHYFVIQAFQSLTKRERRRFQIFLETFTNKIEHTSIRAVCLFYLHLKLLKRRKQITEDDLIKIAMDIYNRNEVSCRRKLSNLKSWFLKYYFKFITMEAILNGNVDDELLIRELRKKNLNDIAEHLRMGGLRKVRTRASEVCNL